MLLIFIALLAIVSVYYAIHIPKTQGMSDDMNRRSSQLFDIAKFLAAFLGAVVLVYSALVNTRLVDNEQRQKLSEQFQWGIQLLDNDEVDLRIGGLFILAQLAEDSQGLRSEVCEVLLERLRSESHRNHLSPTGDRIRFSDLPRDYPVLVRTLVKLSHLSGDHVVDLSELRLNFADFEGLDFTRCRMNGINFADAKLSDCVFRGVDFRSDRFRTSFDDAILSRADFRGANLTESNMVANSLQGAMFTDAILDHAEFFSSVPPDTAHGFVSEQLNDVKSADSIKVPW